MDKKGQAGISALTIILIIIFAAALIFGGLPIFLAVFTHAYLILGIIILVVLWKMGFFDRFF